MNMKETEKINEEIKKFFEYDHNRINQNSNTTPVLKEPKSSEIKILDKLLSILSDLKRNLLIKTDAQNYFNINPITDTKTISKPKNNAQYNPQTNLGLLDLIKSIIEERKVKEQELNDKQKIIDEMEERLNNYINDDIKEKEKYKLDKQLVEEHKRIIKDQKNSIKDMKNKLKDNEREIGKLKTVINEIELANENSNKTCLNLAEENKLFNEYLKAKDNEINKMRMLLNEKKDENKNLLLNIDKNESVIKNLLSKISDQEKNIEVLNEEVIKLINDKDKGDWKYYKGLHESVLKQNEFLNDQLNKLLSPDKKEYEEFHSFKIDEDSLEKKFREINLENKKEKKMHKRKSKRNDESTEEKNYETEKGKNLDKYYSVLDENKIYEKANKNLYKDNHKFNEINKIHEIEKMKNEENHKYENKVHEMEKEKIKYQNEMKNREEKISELADEIILLRNEAAKTNEEKRKINEDLLGKIEKLMEDNRKNQNIIYELKRNKINDNNLNFERNDENLNRKNKVYDDFGMRNPFYDDVNKKNKFYEDVSPIISFHNDENEKLKENKRQNYNMFTEKIPEEKEIDVTKYETAIGNMGYKEEIEEMKQIKKAIKDDSFKIPLFFNETTINENKKEDFELEKKSDESNNIFKTPLIRKKEEKIKSKKNLNRKRGVYSRKMKKHYLSSEKKDSENDDIFESLKNNDDLKEKDKSEKIIDDSTSSTLQNVIKKTEKLKEKFDDLEVQLGKIKEENDGKVQDQGRNYKNYYYSNFIDLENDPDIL